MNETATLISSVVISTVVAFFVGILSNWVYEYLKKKGFAPDNLRIKRFVVIVVGVLTLMAFISAVPNIISNLEVSSRTIIFAVRANQDWQSTGISVSENQLIVIEYLSGSWTTCAPDCSYYTDGVGWDSKLIFGCNFMSLVARVDTDPDVFCVGKYASISAPSSGNLQLRVSDDHVLDNGGEITVKVTVNK